VSLRDYVLPSVLLAGGLAGIGSVFYACKVGNDLENIPEVSRYVSLGKQLSAVNRSREGINDFSLTLDDSSQTKSFYEVLDKRKESIELEINALKSVDKTRENIAAFVNNYERFGSYGGLVGLIGIGLTILGLSTFRDRFRDNGILN